ncbi:hypothetical protein AB9F45_35795, partial [Rhizobium leguminosarum]
RPEGLDVDDALFQARHQGFSLNARDDQSIGDVLETHERLLAGQVSMRASKRKAADRLIITRIQAEPLVPGLKKGIVNVETFRPTDKDRPGAGP